MLPYLICLVLESALCQQPASILSKSTLGLPIGRCKKMGAENMHKNEHWSRRCSSPTRVDTGAQFIPTLKHEPVYRVTLACS